LGFCPPVRPRGAGGFETVAGAFGHEGVLELGDGAEDLEEHAPDGGGGVHALVEHDQVHAAGLEGGGEFDEVFEGPPEPVELGDDELVVFAEHEKCLVQLGAAGELAGGFVGEDPAAAGGVQGVGLSFGVLVAGGDPRVADAHTRERNAKGGARDEGADTGRVTDRRACRRDGRTMSRERSLPDTSGNPRTVAAYAPARPWQVRGTGVPLCLSSRVGQRHRDRGGLLGHPDPAGRLGSLAGGAVRGLVRHASHPNRQRP